TRVAVPADGGIRLPADLADGEYALSARLLSGKLSYSESFAPVRIVGGHPERPLELESPLVLLQGKIRLEGQEQASGVSVSVPGLDLSVETDGSGAYHLGEVPAVLLKDREVRIQKANFVTVSLALTRLTELSDFLSRPELKSVVPLSATSVLQRQAGKIDLATQSGPPGLVWGVLAPVGALADGPADQARFQRPGGMVLDPPGNLYVADTGNHAIRKLGADGRVSTLAGNGSAGFGDGPADQARFNSPNGLALDGAGNLYVSDTGNHAIRKISPTGQVSTLTGGQAGDADGLAAAARFRLPTDLGSDGAGNLYVLDFGNQAIRKITPAGAVETVFRSDWQPRGPLRQLLGDYLAQPPFALPLDQMQGPENARLLAPRSLAVAPDGDLYVTDAVSFLIFRIRPGSPPEYFAGNSRLPQTGSSDARRDSIRFDNPQSLAVDAQGTVYLSDLAHVYRIPAQGLPFKLASIPALYLGYREQARYLAENIFYPGGLLLAPDGGLWLSDRQSHGLYRLWPCDREQAAACGRQTPVYARPDHQLGEFERYGGSQALGIAVPALLHPEEEPRAYLPPEQWAQPSSVPVPTPAPSSAADIWGYQLRIENRSTRLHLGPGIIEDTDLGKDFFFTPGEPEHGMGFEAFAEDGDRSQLLQYYGSSLVKYGALRALTPSGILFWPGNTPDTLAPGQVFESLFQTWYKLAPGRLQVYLKLTASNDRFLSFGPGGLPLQRPDGTLLSGDVSDRLLLWDAGTEADEPTGQGPNQPGRQPYVNAGADENGVVRQVTDPAVPDLRELVRVTVTPLTNAEAARISEENFRRWQSEKQAGMQAGFCNEPCEEP
ncbi:MAG TPA: spondin domain-containing protein, partial [Candidatus Obscuribacterales bacterium]